MKRRNKKIFFVFLTIFILALALGFFLIWKIKLGFKIASGEPLISQKQEMVNSDSGLPKSSISGLSCESAARRPVAVMLSSDQETRPLSGIGEADLVIEMPATPLDQGSITRAMAVYVCASPADIGSVRSARHPFIPLAMGLDAIYAHWGGSHFALDKLKAGIMNNLDGLPNPFDTFYRKSNIPMPHNGFTSMSRLLSAAKQFGWRLDSKFAGYPHINASEISAGKEKKSLAIGFPGEFRVDFKYIPETNSYLRFRGGTKEIDKNTGKQVEAKNIIIMWSKNLPLEGQYNDIKVEGTGEAEYYLNGGKISGKWSKDAKDQKSKLFFYNDKGEEIKFVPGQIWIEIVDPSQNVSWE